MQARSISRRMHPDWLPRAVVSGFNASVVMLLTLGVLYGIAALVSGVQLTDRSGVELFQNWFRNLADNALVDVAAANIYADAAIHFALAMLWALVYAYFAEPRLPGAAWVRGLTFSLLPWLVSMVVIMPLVGGGLFGAVLGAGPFPALGSLIFHLAYGASLGAMYGPLGDMPADSFPEPAPRDDFPTLQRTERWTAQGIIAGLLLGLIVSIVVDLLVQSPVGGSLLGIPSAAFVLVVVVLGGALGEWLGSFGGLEPAR